MGNSPPRMVNFSRFQAHSAFGSLGCSRLSSRSYVLRIYSIHRWLDGWASLACLHY
ncbi:hypothetical protein PENSPDRAFT_459475 [Peniophora sp. CONT]|nr:hypothetical protein PENSPDRAFT_459475 [Peniophora sp. CONT]